MNRNLREQPQRVVPGWPVGGPAAPQEFLGRIVAIGLEQTEWYERVRTFLAEHPHSSLLPIVQHLWPDFLTLPGERRTQTWFWLKGELRELTERGLLRSRVDETGVVIFSLPPAAEGRATGSNCGTGWH